MSLFRNVISKLGTQVQITAETVGQTVGQTVGKRVTESLDAALSSRLGHAVGEAWQKTLSGVTPSISAQLPAWSAKEFEKQIRNRLKPHTTRHPFYIKLQSGQLNQTQLHVWLANEWYCQQNLPLKDAAILSNCEDAAFRRNWTRRLLEQDGGDSGQGAVEHWARLSAGFGLDTAVLQDMSLVTPGVRFAMDTYINFARRAPWTEAVCASLSELQSADYLQQLFGALAGFYGKPDEAAVNFFNDRTVSQKRDWTTAMQAVNEYFKTRDDQEYALDILQFKQDILWTCLDSVSLSPLAQAAASDGQDPLPTVKGEPPQRTRRKKASAPTSPDSGKKQGGRKAKERVSPDLSDDGAGNSPGGRSRRAKPQEATGNGGGSETTGSSAATD